MYIGTFLLILRVKDKVVFEEKNKLKCMAMARSDFLEDGVQSKIFIIK